MSRTEIVNKAKTLSQGAMSESILDKFAMTFTALCAAADFSTIQVQPIAKDDEQRPNTPEPKTDLNIEGSAKLLPNQPQLKASSLGGLHYNIQIILPPTRDAAVYDAIFRSLKEHLID